MSFFQKLLRRKSKSDIKDASTSGSDSSKTEGNRVSEKRSNSASKLQLIPLRRVRRDRNEDDYSDSDIDSLASTDLDERIAERRKQKLKSKINKLR